MSQIHPNGRINYAGAPSRADGADAADVERVAQLDVELAEQELEAAEAAAGKRGGAARLRRAEAQLETRLEAQLEAQLEAALITAPGEDVYAHEASGGASSDSDDAAPPPHFSRMQSRVQGLASPASWPLFREARMLTAEVGAGDALFLPCGWWHEVSSQGADASDTHLAVNWWFAPPDAARFEAPYSSDLWARDWEHWRRTMLPALGA